MEFELPKINVSFEYDKEKDEMVFVINGVEKRVKTEDMITEMEKLQEQNTALEQEPCDCISRKSILNRFENMNEVYTFASIGDLRKVIESMPSVYPKPIECEDCISRAEAINAISHAELSFQVESDLNFENYKREVQEIADGILKGQVKAISNLPSVQPKPKTGHWIAIDEEPHEDYECDKCGYIISTYTANIEPHTEYKYCPNCGAKMTESEEV